MLRFLLSAHAGCRPEDLRFGREHNGKPVLLGPQCNPPLTFNLAHCHLFSACAVARGLQLGIDVEPARRQISPLVAQRYLSAEEWAHCETLEFRDRSAAWVSLWTLKESFVKCCGDGLARDLREVSFLKDRSGLRSFLPLSVLGFDWGDWRFYSGRLMDSYLYAVTLRLTAKQYVRLSLHDFRGL